MKCSIMFKDYAVPLSVMVPCSSFCTDTAVSDIEDAFKSFTNRSDIAIVLINQNVCEMSVCSTLTVWSC